MSITEKLAQSLRDSVNRNRIYVNARNPEKEAVIEWLKEMRSDVVIVETNALYEGISWMDDSVNVQMLLHDHEEREKAG